MSHKVKRLVVKIGTSLLTRDGGHLDNRRLSRFVKELAALRKSGVEVLLVTSGAIAAGRGELGMKQKPHAMGQKQAAAAVGQIRLMERYRRFFAARGVAVGQILLTKEDFSSRSRAQNAQATLAALLQLKVIPIINENDTVAVDEIRVGDNDSLAALVAILVKADLVVLLTDVEGLMDKHPKDGGSKIIRRVDHIGPQIEAIANASPGSDGGTGGMLTKVRAAKWATSRGVPMVIASGKRAGVLQAVAQGQPIGTLFPV
jgi:glutamate 5-kinase